jgi:hypothetical protein
VKITVYFLGYLEYNRYYKLIMIRSYMNKLIKLIAQISNSADLNVIIRAIKAQQKNIRASEASAKRAIFNIGDAVNVASKTGLRPGVITKVNRVRCDVTINNQSFSVPMSIMEAA